MSVGYRSGLLGCANYEFRWHAGGPTACRSRQQLLAWNTLDCAATQAPRHSVSSSGADFLRTRFNAKPRSAVTAAARSKPQMVLESQPMLSDLLTETTGPWETIALKAALDIALPILCLWGLLKLVDWAADQARVTIDARVAGDSDVVDELKRQSTLWGLVLLSMRTPAKLMLPPWLLAYTLRTTLNIVDLLVNKYQPRLPQLLDYVIKQVSAQLVPLDAALETLLTVSGVAFAAWFFVQLKDILIREVLLVRAIRSGRKDLDRVYLPLSSLVTWAAVLACALSICTSLGLNLKPLLAVGGAGGIAAGFASQQLLLNVVAGVNIFLTRPFIAGDQVVFEGGANLEGTVEGVEITRTLMRTADGTLVALPNKLVSDLIVYNRTRALDTATASAAPLAAAAAPLRRVLCFTLKLDRSLEPQLGDIRKDVRGLLNQITKEQLLRSGWVGEDDAFALTASSSTSSLESVASEGGSSSSNGSDGAQLAGGSSTEDGVTGPSGMKVLAEGSVVAAVSAAAAAAAHAVAAVATKSAGEPEEQQQQQGDAEAVTESHSDVPEPEPLLVSITLKQLTESTIVLFVRCEILLPDRGGLDAVESQTEDILMAISGLVREKYGAVVLW